MNESTQELLKKLLNQIRQRDNIIKNLTEISDIQDVRYKEIERKYKNTVLFLSILLSTSMVIIIILISLLLR